MKPPAKLSGIKADVLSLYRNLLRTGRTKEDVTVVQSYIRQKFREDARSLKRSDFKRIEHMMRQGHRKLKILKLPGTKLVGSGANIPSSGVSKRTFSTQASSIQWDTTSRPRAHIVSLGCGRNWVDSEVMLGDFLRAGYEIESVDPSSANLIVVNTCGFLKSARDEGNEEIQRVIDVKSERSERGLSTCVVVTGCMVNLDKAAVLERHPEIDHLVGAAGIGQVLQVVERKERMYAIPSSSKDQRSHLEEDLLLTALATGEAPPARLLATPPHLAYLKIAEGCRKRCTFCIIPVIKGPLRSKSIPQVVREFRSLVNGAGVKEVSLIAQDLGDYGKDANQTPISETETTNEVSIQEEEVSITSQTPQLLKLLNEVGEVGKELNAWIRLLYLYPDEISSDLLELMGDNSILPYLDMPMQHVSTSVLQRMGRKAKYDRAALEKTIELVQKTKTAVTECGVAMSPWRDPITGLGGVSIRTTLMVGFPGESEADFQELLEFLNGPHGSALTHVGVFSFSPEAKARASKFDDQVSESVKRRRKRQVEAVYNRNLRRRQQALVDQSRLIVVLIDHITKGDTMRVVGRHPGQALAVDGIVDVQAFGTANQLKEGDVVIAKVVGYNGLDIIANFERYLSTGSAIVK